MSSLMTNVLCANEQNNFPILDDEPDCLTMLNRRKITECAGKAISTMLRRFMEKSLENEHFELKLDAKDCK